MRRFCDLGVSAVTLVSTVEKIWTDPGTDAGCQDGQSCVPGSCSALGV